MLMGGREAWSVKAGFDAEIARVGRLAAISNEVREAETWWTERLA
jgi:hypothetical protein